MRFEMDIDNRTVIIELTKYFLDQDRETIARALAGAMLDIHRFVNMEILGQNEIDNLFKRSHHISKQLVKFAKHGPDGPLKVSVLNSDDEYE